MPPKAKITREMIIDAGMEVVREQGIENVNARTVSQKLGCSTQPVMYHFQKIEDMKKAIYQRADEYHTAFLDQAQGDDPMLAIGLAYIRFAQTEKNLFRLLFQSNGFEENSISRLADTVETAPFVTALSRAAGVEMAQAGRIFKSLFLYVHGYAGLFANNDLEYNEDVIAADLEHLFAIMVYAAKGGLW